MLATRILALKAESYQLHKRLRALTAGHAPELLERRGIGPDSAAALLTAAGDNPERLRSEGSYAPLCGASPVEASSGKTRRRRLNAAATGKPTPPSTESPCPGCAGTPAPRTTCDDASPKARPAVRPSAAFYRVLVSGEPVTDLLAEQLVSLLLDGDTPQTQQHPVIADHGSRSGGTAAGNLEGGQALLIVDTEVAMTSEPEGFREFVAARSATLLRTAWMLTGDGQLAEDLLQTALARTWPHWSRVRDGQPDAYVRRVMVRVHGAWWRRRWRGETPTAQVPEVAGADAYAGVDDRAVLAAALARLPTRQRQVVVLRYYDDLPEREVAALLGCSVGTVKSHAARGLVKLRVALEPRVEAKEETR
jgi:RNA polymerase sigma-70 factor (sigma-E family)